MHGMCDSRQYTECRPNVAKQVRPPPCYRACSVQRAGAGASAPDRLKGIMPPCLKYPLVFVCSSLAPALPTLRNDTWGNKERDIQHTPPSNGALNKQTRMLRPQQHATCFERTGHATQFWRALWFCSWTEASALVPTMFFHHCARASNICSLLPMEDGSTFIVVQSNARDATELRREAIQLEPTNVNLQMQMVRNHVMTDMTSEHDDQARHMYPDKHIIQIQMQAST